MRLGWILFLLGWGWAGLAVAGEVTLLDSKEHFEIASKTSYFATDLHDLGPAELLEDSIEPLLKPLGGPVNFGIDGRAFYYRVDLYNPGLKARRLILQLQTLESQSKAYLTPLGPCEAMPHTRTFEIPDPPHRVPHIVLEIPACERFRLWIAKEEQGNQSFQAVIWQEVPFHMWDARERMHEYLYFGVSLIMLLYNFFLFLSLRDRAYLSYTLGVLFLGLFFAGVHGFGAEIFWPSYHEVNQDLSGFFSLATAIFFQDFILRLCQTKTDFPRLFRWAQGVNILYLAVGVSYFVFPFTWFVSLLVLVGFAFTLVTLVACIQATRKNPHLGIYLIPGIVIYNIGVIIMLLSLVGWGNFDDATHVWQYCALAEITFFALALADRINQLTLEKERVRLALFNETKKHANELEKQVKERTVDLLKANRDKDRFLAILAHDLRGPVSAMASAFHAVQNGAIQMDKEMTSVMAYTAETLHQQLETLLSWAKAQHGSFDPKPENFLLGDLVRQITKLQAEQLRQKKLTLSVEVPGDLWVMADINMTATLIRNLVSNALKFTPPSGQITLLAEARGKEIWVAVRDTGLGMSPEKLAQVLSDTEQVESGAGTSGERGYGFGLSLCKSFARQIGGRFGAESQPGEGSLFWFTLPMGKSKKMARELAGLKVLFADDKEMNRRLGQSILEALRAKVFLALDGQHLVDLALQDEYDLILTDLDMPVLDGGKATLKIQSEYQARGKNPPPMVAVTSLDPEDAEYLIGKARFQGFLRKPLEEGEILTLASELGLISG